MWRLVVLASLLLTLALGSVAEAKCWVCIQSVSAEKSDAGTALRFTASGHDASAFPETGTAVVMQVDGNRSKCINVTIRKIDVSGGLATYSGLLTSSYGNSSFTGRVDLAGEIHEFSVPLDGTPGKLQWIASADAANAAPVQAAPIVVTPVPLPTTAAPIVAAEPVAQVKPSESSQPDLSWIGLMGIAVVMITIASAYFDRRRALARAGAG